MSQIFQKESPSNVHLHRYKPTSSCSYSQATNLNDKSFVLIISKIELLKAHGKKNIILKIGIGRSFKEIIFCLYVVEAHIPPSCKVVKSHAARLGR